MTHETVAAFERTRRRVQIAIGVVGAGILVYIVALIAVLSQLRLPSTLPPWAIVPALPLVAAVVAIPVLRSWAAVLSARAARVQLAAAARSIDELERGQRQRRGRA